MIKPIVQAVDDLIHFTLAPNIGSPKVSPAVLEQRADEAVKRIMLEGQLSIVPVDDKTGRYAGHRVVSPAVLDYFNQVGCSAESGQLLADKLGARSPHKPESVMGLTLPIDDRYTVFGRSLHNLLVKSQRSQDPYPSYGGIVRVYGASGKVFKLEDLNKSPYIDIRTTINRLSTRTQS